MFQPPTPLLTGELPVSAGAAFVYRAYDKDGDLLYVGLADHVLHRLGGHRDKRAEWLDVAVRIEWEMYGSREDAAWVERRTIIDQQPDFNITHNQRRLAGQGLGHRRSYDAAAWSRLGSLLRDARTTSGMTQKSMAASAGVTAAQVRALENGARDGWTGPGLAVVEAGLWWRAGSIEAVLAGGDPTLMTRAERMTRALIAAQALLEGR